MTQNSKETKQKRNEKRRKFTNLKKEAPKYIEQKCIDCGELKFCKFNSTFNIHGIPEYKSRCDECHNTNERRYKKRKRKHFNLLKQKLVRKRKAKYVNYLGGKCKICGYNKSLRALTFHHENREEKKFGISQIIDHAWEKVKAELDKCILVCFNCHMELEEQFENERLKELA